MRIRGFLTPYPIGSLHLAGLADDRVFSDVASDPKHVLRKLFPSQHNIILYII